MYKKGLHYKVKPKISTPRQQGAAQDLTKDNYASNLLLLFSSVIKTRDAKQTLPLQNGQLSYEEMQ